MKNIPTLILFFFCIGVSAQNINKINSDLKLSDTLGHQTEVRIYQSVGITNYSSLFRMFRDKSGKWTAEFYEHYAKVDDQTELQIKKKALSSINEMEFVYLSLQRSYILDLPDLSEIQWKLVIRGNIEKVKQPYRGKKVEKYELMNKKEYILDGESYKVQVKGIKNNHFEFSNPDEYLKLHPEIDELNYMCEILNTIRNEFGIWKKNHK